MVQKTDNCEKSESIKNLNEKVLFIGNQKKNFCLDSAYPENRASIIVPTVNHTERDQLLNQNYCTSTTNITRKNTVQTTSSNKQRTIGLDLLTKTTSTEEIPKRDISGTMEFDLVEELYKPFQEDFYDIDFSTYSILQDLIDDSPPSVDDCSGEASPTPATTAETTSTTLTPNIELKEEISPAATTNQMDDLFFEFEEDQLYGETVTQPDPAEMDFLTIPNDLNNEDTINLNETCLRVGSPSRVLKKDPFLFDCPTHVKPIKAELNLDDTVLSHESFSDIFFTSETLPYDTNNNSSNINNNMESKSIKSELLFEGIVSSQESLPSIFNTPETITQIRNSNNGQKTKFEERKRKLYSTEGNPRPKKLILPMSRMVTAEEVFPSTPEVIEKALDLEQERFPTSYINSNNSFDLLLQNEVSTCPSEDLSSNSSTVFTAPSTPFSYPSTSTTPTPTSQKRRGRPPKTDDSLPNPEELEHLSEKEKKYYELRGKNNMASRKSRQRRKYKEEKSKQELEELQRQNTALTSKCGSLEAIEKQLKTLLQKQLL